MRNKQEREVNSNIAMKSIPKKALLTAILLGAAPAMATSTDTNLSTPTLGDESAYTLTQVDTAVENTITKFEYNSSTGEFTPVYYQMNLKQTSYGHPDVADEVRYYKFAENGSLTDGTADDYDITYSVDSSRVGDSFYNKTSINADAIGIETNYGVLHNDAASRDILINEIKGDFVENIAKRYGASSGAIFNEADYGYDSIIENITGNFIGNVGGNGAAIYNRSLDDNSIAQIGNIIGDFIGNSAKIASGYTCDGGAIANRGIIGGITGSFIRNTASGGGAIFNDSTGEIQKITGDFIMNKANSSGGAIYNDSHYSSPENKSKGYIASISGDFIGNSANSSGGAIYNSGEIKEITGDFIENTAQSAGAIANGATINQITGDFIGNTAQGDGGALRNNGEITTLYSDFIGNYASDAGGAIVNSDTIGNITGNFSANHSGGGGGAIATGGSINNVTGDFIKNFVTGDISTLGGAINNNGNMADINGNFIGNYVQSVAPTNGMQTAQGGAIWNGGTIKKIEGLFKNNYAQSEESTYRTDVYGGAIYNNNNIQDIQADFDNNKVQGATDYGACGGAIANIGNEYDYIAVISNITGNFTNNSSQSSGGAIYNSVGYINITDSNFSNNTSGNGGAIADSYYLHEQTGDVPAGPASLELYANPTEPIESQKPFLGIKNTTFNGNTSEYTGGAISGYYEYNLEKYTGGAEPPRYEPFMLMSETVTEATPATYAETPVISIENSSFQNNIAKAGDGGAISFYYNENIQTYHGQSLPEQPRSLVLADSGISLLEAGGYPEATTPEFQKTSNFLNIKNSEFVGNKSAQGGAISFSYNKVETNIAKEPPAQAESLLPDETEPEYKLVLENTSFANNSVALPEDYTPSEYGDNLISQGGAIFTNADTKIIADNGNSIFSNNTVTSNDVTQKNDIYIVSNTNSTINMTPDENNWNMVPSIDATQEKFNPVTLSLEAKNNGTISFDGTIDGEATYIKAVLDENAYNGNWYDYFETEKLDTPYAYNLDIKGDETGRVIFNNDVKNANVTVENTNVYFGTRDNIFDGNNLELKSGMLSMVNDTVGISSLNTFTVTGDTNFVADVDLANQTMDRITADEYGEHSGNLNVIGMNLLNDAPVDRDLTEILFAEPGVMDNVVNGTGELPDAFQTAYTPIYKYNVAYETREDDGGYFVFSRGGLNSGNDSDNFNPSVLSTPVANLAAGQAAMNEAFKYVFEHADSFTQLPAMERYAKINANKYALSTDFNDNMPSYVDNLHNKGIWFRPYTTFESMNIKNGPDVDAITYGSLVGFDGDFKEMKNGWHRVFTGYAGYMGSSLNYSGVDTTMNGGLLGFTETFYKGNFWTAITASAGASVGESHSMYGKEDYTSLLAGVGSKTGYNFEFKDGKFIIQPIMFLSYTFVNTFDYKNAAGVNIESDPLHTIQLNPSVRFIANLKGGWQPYASVGMVWNLMNESKVTANNVRLPEMSVKPYVEYGVGVQRNWADKFTAFLQAMIRNGGRNGISLTGGFRFMLGSDDDNDSPKVKKEIKSL